MAGEASAQREKQDQSIKARKNELFVGEQVEETGPRKKLRDYLKETPAAPLSKNVKLSLWGSAVPVVLLFVVALVNPNRTTAKAPTEVIWTAPKLATPPPLVSRTDDKPPAPAGETKAGDNKDKAAASSDKPAEEKSKAKPKKPPKKGNKSKPKDTVIAQSNEGDKANGDKDKDKGNDDSSGDSKKKPNNASSNSGNKDKMGGSKDAKGKSVTPAPPRKQAASILVKKKKPYNPAYPSKTPVGEKKADPDADAGIP
jgi:hypothetical protein